MKQTSTNGDCVISLMNSELRVDMMRQLGSGDVQIHQAEDEFPTWLIVIIIITASVAGFAQALVMRSKKKTEAGDVY